MKLEDKKEYLKGKLDELETNSNIKKKILQTCGGASVTLTF